VAGLGSQIAKDRPRVRVRLLDGRAGEADERRIGQGIAQVAGEAIGHLAGLLIHLAAEAILAAVRFIRDHDNVLPCAQLGHRLALFRHEFMNGREHNAAFARFSNSRLAPKDSCQGGMLLPNCLR
jgi:hypothetical protein